MYNQVLKRGVSFIVTTLAKQLAATIPIGIAMHFIYLYFFDINIGFGPLMLLLVCFVLMIVSMATSLTYSKNFFSFSVSRKSFYMIVGVSNILISLLASIVCGVFLVLFSKLDLGIIAYILIFVLMLFCNVIGNFFGASMLRFGVWGFVIYMVVFMGVIMSAIPLFVFSGFSFEGVVAFFSGSLLPSGIILLASALLFFINCLLLGKYYIK